MFYKMFYTCFEGKMGFTKCFTRVLKVKWDLQNVLQNVLQKFLQNVLQIFLQIFLQKFSQNVFSACVHVRARMSALFRFWADLP